MIPGIEFDFGGGRVYLVPPLSLGALELLQERIGQVLQTADPQSIATTLDVAFHALRRNYPDITREQVGELVDLGNMAEVFEVVMDVSGVRRRALEAQRQGKAAAEIPGGGPASSPASAASPAGPGTT
ncbi:MAG: hypothetical protein ACOZJZ_12645 [Pseudomonadota bacterium]